MTKKKNRAQIARENTGQNADTLKETYKTKLISVIEKRLLWTTEQGKYSCTICPMDAETNYVLGPKVNKTILNEALEEVTMLYSSEEYGFSVTTQYWSASKDHIPSMTLSWE